MKTPIQEIFKNNRWLAEKIANHNKKVKNKIANLHASTIRKAVRGEKVNFDTKFEIRACLIDLWIIRQSEYTTTELFGETSLNSNK